MLELRIEHSFRLSVIGDYYRTCGAILNRYRPQLTMTDATVELARALIARVGEVNQLQERVENEGLEQRSV